MKISLNTVKQYLDFELPPVNELVNKIGAQLGGVDEIIDFGVKYNGIVIAKVVTCEKHPNADKLSLCKIDDGGVIKDVERDDQGHVQVVCGAPNVREGLTVAWLPPGSTVPESVGKDPFVLEARELRGSVSNGMLASVKELALGEDHNGILEIDGDHKPGADFAEAYGLKNDVVIDIENKMFTHRPDCFGFLGIARELAGIQNTSFKSPDWYVVNPEFPDIEANELILEIKNELPAQVRRFTALTMSNIQVGPSPVWLQVELAKVGQKSINNIVDYTNWFMLETGQPLHAYDYDKVNALSSGASAVIVVRNPRANEKIKLLNGKEIDPRQEAIMIATDRELIGVGGVMGGSETEVDENTKNIILECANFDMYSVRRTSMEHGLFTDAVTRFTKGQSPLQNLAVLAKIVAEIREHAGGKIAGHVIDDNNLDEPVLARQSLHFPVKVAAGFINARLGLKLSAEEMKKHLEDTEFKIEIKGDDLIVAAPFWRTDIELREDIVEEIGRLYGYDNLPLEMPKRSLTPAQEDPLLNAKAAIRERLSKAGANEILTYSFVHGNLLDKTGQDKSKAYQVANALSPDLQYYRMSLIPNLLEKVHPNIKAGYDEFALFEIGKTHSLDHGNDDDNLPREYEFTALVVAAADKLKKSGTAYYEARKYLQALIGQADLEFKPIGEDMQQYSVVQPYEINRAALVSIKGGKFLGIIGEFKPSVARALKLPKYSAGFEIDTTVLQPILISGPTYSPLSRFPKVTQDITLKVPSALPFQELFNFIEDELKSNVTDKTLLNLEAVDIYQKEDNQEHKNITLRLSISSYERTLTDDEVNALLNKSALAAKEKLQSERI